MRVAARRKRSQRRKPEPGAYFCKWRALVVMLLLK